MKKCLIVVNTKKKDSQSYGKMISEYLSTKGIFSSFYSFDGFSEDDPFLGVDFVVTLGGDGTVLFAARGCVSKKIPVFAVNFGEFGFIASVQKDEWKTELDRFLDGKSIVEERSMLQAALLTGDEKRQFSSSGLNDVVICAKSAASTISLEVTYNEIPLGRFKSDGVIVSTATGSTAYSASAGGPIIDPEMDAFVLTPINSFSLSARQSNVIIIVDGQHPFDLREGDVVKVRRISDRFRLVGGSTEGFYDALRSKLNWSGGPHA